MKLNPPALGCMPEIEESEHGFRDICSEGFTGPWFANRELAESMLPWHNHLSKGRG